MAIIENIDMREFMQDAINKELTVIADKEFELMKERIEKRKAEIVAGVVLYTEKMISMESIGETLKIEVRSNNNK